jgi:hypothetical protein
MEQGEELRLHLRIQEALEELLGPLQGFPLMGRIIWIPG